jgi:hypothetical protein
LQRVSVGKHRAGARVDVHVTDQLLQIWHGAELLKTVKSDHSGDVRRNARPNHRRGPDLKQRVKDQPT